MLPEVHGINTCDTVKNVDEKIFQATLNLFHVLDCAYQC